MTKSEFIKQVNNTLSGIPIKGKVSYFEEGVADVMLYVEDSHSSENIGEYIDTVDGELSSLLTYLSGVEMGFHATDAFKLKYKHHEE